MPKGPPVVTERLKPLLTKGHFSMLLGAGASVCAGYPLIDDLTHLSSVLCRGSQAPFCTRYGIHWTKKRTGTSRQC